MSDAKKLLGRAQGLTEGADSVQDLKAALSETLEALEAALKEIETLRRENDELNEYVSRVDDDLAHLELIHDDELEEYDDYFGLDDDEDEPDDEDELDDEDETDDGWDEEEDGPEDEEPDGGSVDFEAWKKKHDK